MRFKFKIVGALCSLIVFLLYSCNSKLVLIYQVSNPNDECYYESFSNTFAIIKKKGHYVVTKDSNTISEKFKLKRRNKQDIFYEVQKDPLYLNKVILYTNKKDTIISIDVFEKNNLPLEIDIKRFYVKDTLVVINKHSYSTSVFKSLSGRRTLLGHSQTEVIDYVDENLMLPVRREYYFYDNSGKLKPDKSFSVNLVDKL